ncbi:DNA-binding protein [Acidovorax sp. LjRoot118]|uniref:DNA-binding protein n=1 Tax=Acidovorax sp. LjRoot118 TaxID=3342256 RepID=UPI003ECD8AA6
MPLKTRQEVRNEFALKGLSFSAWAKQRGYSVALVSLILNDDQVNPRRKCLRGESHNIAVDLGLKTGIPNVGTFRPLARPQLAAAA